MSEINKIFKKYINVKVYVEDFKNKEKVESILTELNSLLNSIHSIPQYQKLVSKVNNKDFGYRLAQRRLREYNSVETVINNRIAYIKQAAEIASSKNKQQELSKCPALEAAKEIMRQPSPMAEPQTEYPNRKISASEPVSE